MISQCPESVVLTLGSTMESPGDPKNIGLTPKNSDSTSLVFGPGLVVNLDFWPGVREDRRGAKDQNISVHDTMLMSPPFMSEQAI